MKKLITCVYCKRERGRTKMIPSLIHRGGWCCKNPTGCLKLSAGTIHMGRR